jgi:hypothetical protein
MTVLLVHFEIADDGVAEVTAAVEATFAAVQERQPEGVRYAYLRRAGGTEFIALLELAEGVENPLPGIEAARQLQARVARWTVGTLQAPQPFDVLGDYRLLS